MASNADPVHGRDHVMVRFHLSNRKQWRFLLKFAAFPNHSPLLTMLELT